MSIHDTISSAHLDAELRRIQTKLKYVDRHVKRAKRAAHTLGLDRLEDTCRDLHRYIDKILTRIETLEETEIKP